MQCIISCSVEKKHNADVDFLYTDYTEFFENLGVDIIPISNALKNIESYIDKFSVKGIILSGGNDIGSASIRDEQEKRLLDIAIKRNIPVLGICRGMEFINYYFSSKMPVDIKASVKNPIEHVRSLHPVIIKDAEWQKMLGKDEITVNSYHNQGYAEESLAEALDVLALAKDGVVEAFRHKDHPIFGVQWHPEREGSDSESDKRIIDSFKEICCVKRVRK